MSATERLPADILEGLFDLKNREGQVFPRGNLTHAVHPIFAQSRFDPQLDYDRFLPALQLLTRLFDTPQMQYYLYVLFFGTDHDVGVRDNEGKPRLVRSSDRTIHSLSQDDIEDVEECLLVFPRVTSFHVDEKISYGGRCENVRNYRPLKVASGPYGRDLSASNLATLLHSPFKIYLNLNLYQSIKPGECTTRSLFKVAATLLHELGHAFDRGTTAESGFIEESMLSEAGFEIEARAFGFCFSNFDDGAIRADLYPDREIIRTYASFDATALVCRDLDALPIVSRRHRVPDYWISSLFHQWFWDAIGRSLDARALIPRPVAENILACPPIVKRPIAPRSIVDLLRKEPLQNEGM